MGGWDRGGEGGIGREVVERKWNEDKGDKFGRGDGKGGEVEWVKGKGRRRGGVTC